VKESNMESLTVRLGRVREALLEERVAQNTAETNKKKLGKTAEDRGKKKIQLQPSPSKHKYTSVKKDNWWAAPIEKRKGDGWANNY